MISSINLWMYSRMYKNEAELILKNYLSGLTLINENKGVGSSFFYKPNKNDETKLKELLYGFVKTTGKQSYLRNPDLFYSTARCIK